MGKKSASVHLTGAEIGWHGSQGGRTVEIHFRNGKDPLGAIRISEAAVWWRPRGGKYWSGKRRIPVEKLFELFQKRGN